MENVFVSNVKHYTGPGVVQVLSESGYRVICHDPSFKEKTERDDFSNSDNIQTISGQNPDEIMDELMSYGQISRFVFNDVHPNTPKPIEEIAVEELRETYSNLLEFPFLLTQKIIPDLKAQKSGAIAFITSARQLQPETGFALATSMRAGATAFALSVARELAPFNIQVNAIQPNYLYSELYYPKAKFIDDPDGRAEIAAKVPAGRLGDPEEFGQLVEFYISGRSPFTTGQVINFTGGWP